MINKKDQTRMNRESGRCCAVFVAMFIEIGSLYPYIAHTEEILDSHISCFDY